MEPDRLRCSTGVTGLFAILAGAAITACTFDFDKFAANPDGLSGTADAGMRQGGAGASNAGGAAGTGGQGGVAVGTGGSTGTAGCSGVLYSGICWYLGPQGSSCEQVCAGHGQPASDAATHVGTGAQGGSLAECGHIFGLLGITGTPTQGTRSDGLGLGCHVYQGTNLWWLSSPNFSATASQASSKLVCGCTQ